MRTGARAVIYHEFMYRPTDVVVVPDNSYVHFFYSHEDIGSRGVDVNINYCFVGQYLCQQLPAERVKFYEWIWMEK